MELYGSLKRRFQNNEVELPIWWIRFKANLELPSYLQTIFQGNLMQFSVFQSFNWNKNKKLESTVIIRLFHNFNEASFSPDIHGSLIEICHKGRSCIGTWICVWKDLSWSRLCRRAVIFSSLPSNISGLICSRCYSTTWILCRTSSSCGFLLFPSLPRIELPKWVRLWVRGVYVVIGLSMVEGLQMSHGSFWGHNEHWPQKCTLSRSWPSQTLNYTHMNMLLKWWGVWVIMDGGGLCPSVSV